MQFFASAAGGPPPVGCSGHSTQDPLIYFRVIVKPGMYSVTPTGYRLLFGCYLGSFKVVLAQTACGWGRPGLLWFAHDQLKICSRSVTVVQCRQRTLLRHSSAVRGALTFRHRASYILGHAFRYSPENAFYIFNQQIYFII